MGVEQFLRPGRAGRPSLGTYGEIIAQTIPPPESPEVYSSIVARIAHIIVWAVILVLGVLTYYRYLDLAPMD
jgi:hypothetical protein